MSVWLASLARPFYERHAGLLAFVFFVMFGMVESSQIIYYHYSLIMGALQSPVFLLLVFGVWMAYTLKSLSFTQQWLHKPTHEFLFMVGGLPPRHQASMLLQYHGFIHAPVVVYALVMVGVAIYHRAWWAATSIIVVQGALALAAVWCYRQLLMAKQPWRLPALRLPLPGRYPLFYIQLLLSELTGAFFRTKIFSWLAIVGFMHIEHATTDMRIPLLGLSIGLLAHTVLIFEFRKAEETTLAWVRNLPWSVSHRWLLWALTYALVMIPEVVVLAVRFSTVSIVPMAMAVATGFCLLLHASLVRPGWSMERLTKIGFMSFLLLFGTTTAGLHPYAMALAWLLSYGLYAWYFPRADPSEPLEKT